MLVHRTLVTLAVLLAIDATIWAKEAVWRFDCGTDDSPVMEGFSRLTAEDAYDASRGYGWEGGAAAHLEFRRPVRDLNLRGSAGQLFSVHAEGQRLILPRQGGERQEVELARRAGDVTEVGALSAEGRERASAASPRASSR